MQARFCHHKHQPRLRPILPQGTGKVWEPRLPHSYLDPHHLPHWGPYTIYCTEPHFPHQQNERHNTYLEGVLRGLDDISGVWDLNNTGNWIQFLLPATNRVCWGSSWLPTPNIFQMKKFSLLCVKNILKYSFS